MSLVVGQDIAVTITCLNPDGGSGNPATVQFKVKSPSGTTTTYSGGAVQTLTSGKIYRCQFDASESGVWSVRSEALDGLGAVVGTDEVLIHVSSSKVI